jgi:hypothetical protein
MDVIEYIEVPVAPLPLSEEMAGLAEGEGHD